MKQEVGQEKWLSVEEEHRVLSQRARFYPGHPRSSSASHGHLYTHRPQETVKQNKETPKQQQQN